MTLEISFLLPIAAFVAVILFIVKEALEYRRNKASDSRKLQAAKKLLAFETERNCYTKNQLFRIFHDVRSSMELEQEFDYIALIKFGENAQYRRTARTSNPISSGMPIPNIHSYELERLLPQVAELDNNLFSESLDFYEQIFEIRHLRTSLMEYLLGEQEEVELHMPGLFEGFIEYALEHEREMDEAFESFYETCTGTKKIPIRMR